MGSAETWGQWSRATGSAEPRMGAAAPPTGSAQPCMGSAQPLSRSWGRRSHPGGRRSPCSRRRGRRSPGAEGQIFCRDRAARASPSSGPVEAGEVRGRARLSRRRIVFRIGFGSVHDRRHIGCGSPAIDRRRIDSGIDHGLPSDSRGHRRPRVCSGSTLGRPRLDPWAAVGLRSSRVGPSIDQGSAPHRLVVICLGIASGPTSDRLRADGASMSDRHWPRSRHRP